MSKIAFWIVLTALWSTTLSAKSCESTFMHDPCPLDGYSIVNTEKFIKGRHNWMHDIHHFGETRKTVRKKRVLHKKRVHKKRRYRYVKRCRTVKVRM